MRFDYSNHVVVISGGTGSLGSVVTNLFLQYNAKQLIVTYRSNSQLDQLKQYLMAQNSISDINKQDNIDFLKIDVTDEKEIENLISYTVKKHDKIDILVNLVGGYLGGKTANKIGLKEWVNMIDLNLTSAFLLTKHVLPSMISNQQGKIVHISSMTGLKSNGQDSAYAASKAALIRFVESVAAEVKNNNININCVLPTIIDTVANRHAMPDADFSKWQSPVDLSYIILFMCSEYAKIINGAAIPTVN